MVDELTTRAPVVSVIVIFLNEEQFLSAAIASVFAQTYRDWELLLIDDGSSDRSRVIGEQAAVEHPDRVRLLSHPNRENRGMSASRNLGLAHARGRYVAYLDGDDVWREHKLERQVKILETNPEALMTCGPLEAWFSWTGREADAGRDQLYGVGLGAAHPYANQLVRPPALVTLFLREAQFIPAGILVHREALERVGGAEEEFRGSYEDAVLHVKLCTTIPVYIDNDVSYRYRIHPRSASRRDQQLGLADAHQRRYLDWVARYLDDAGIGDPTLHRALRIAQWRLRHPSLHRLGHVRAHLSRLEHFLVSSGRRFLPPSVSARLWRFWKLLLRSPSPAPGSSGDRPRITAPDR